MPYRTVIATIKSGGLFLSAIGFSMLEIKYLPPPHKILILMVVMTLDLMTGLLKSWKRGHFTTSTGFKQTAIKIGTYAAIVLTVSALATVLDDISPTIVDYAFVVSATVGFLTFIEIFSIFENIYALDPNSKLSRYLATPVIKWLKGYLKDNPPTEGLPESDFEPDLNNDPPSGTG